MKILIASLLFASVISISCNNSEKNRIVGKWTVNKAYASRSKEATGMFTRGQTHRIDSLLTREFAGTTYDFSAEGKVTIAVGEEHITGTWEMGKDEKNGNAELSMIIMKGEGWEEAWIPGVGKSLFYMGEIDAINAHLMPPKDDGTSVIYNLSKSKK